MKTLQNFWNFIAQTKTLKSDKNKTECNYANDYYGDQVCMAKDV